MLQSVEADGPTLRFHYEIPARKTEQVAERVAQELREKNTKMYCTWDRYRRLQENGGQIVLKLRRQGGEAEANEVLDEVVLTGQDCTE